MSTTNTFSLYANIFQRKMHVNKKRTGGKQNKIEWNGNELLNLQISVLFTFIYSNIYLFFPKFHFLFRFLFLLLLQSYLYIAQLRLL